MKPCVYGSHSSALQLSHPFAACKTLPCSFPSLSSMRKIAGKDHASLWGVRVQRRCSKPLRITVFLLNKDGGGAKTYTDQWYRNVNLFLWGVLQKWGPPTAVGAMVGSIVARKTLIFLVSFSFVLLMAVHKAIESQVVHLKRISGVLSRQSLIHILAATRLFFSTATLHLSGALMTRLNQSSKLIDQLLVPMRALLVESSLTWSQKQGRDIAKDVALGSAFKSADTLVADINACIQNVEGIMMTEKDIPTDTSWTELKDSLSSLKTQVAFLSRVERNISVPSTDVLAPLTPSVQVTVKKLKPSASVKSKRSHPKHTEINQSCAVAEEKMLGNTIADMLKQESLLEKPGKLDVMNGMDVSLTGRVASTKQTSAVASEVSLDLGSGLPLKESEDIAVPDAQTLDVASVKVGESESCYPRNKYIDYWTEQDPLRSVSSPLLGDMEEQKSNAVSKNLHHQREGSGLPAGQDFEKEIASKTLSSDLGRKSLHSADHPSRVKNEVRFKKTGSMTNIFVKENDGDGFSKHARSMKDHGHVAGWIDSKDKDMLNESQNPLLGANVNNESVVEQAAALIGSTKELAFVREDADLHVLTGFSRSFDDGEFQKLMIDGETALKHGKAGLFGKIAVGEAETMLYKAADHFASAVALDLSSVEAVGFWGNTLLVHGELKLMLSRELRHLISTPDVISPYLIRQTKGMEAHERSNCDVLQRKFRTVCEECEELLIQAGRKYRRVLSISNSEVRALYNWGLALCFRAQLIAEEGGQDGREAADRIYLAAIDKFEAMMGISQRYAPGAMLNWGLTLKDRSRLRPSGSAERIGLLQQAKQLLLDALRLQPDDAQIHSAFVTCCVELKELNERQELQTKRSMKPFFGK